VLVAVPCSEADTVALLDASDGSDAGRIAVGSHPAHLASSEGRVLVATMGERSVDVISDGGVERVTTGVLGPSHFALVGNRAFVPCTGGDAVAIVDLESLEHVERVAVGAEPHDAEAVGDVVYVGSRGDGTVSVLDAETATVRGTVDAASDSATQARVQGLAAAPQSGVYAIDQTNARVVLLDDEGVRAAASVGENPYEPVVDGDRVFVAGRNDGTVSELSLDLSSTTTHDVGGQPVDVHVVGETTWVFDRDRSDARSLDGATVDLPHPGFAAVSDPKRPARVYVSHYDDDAVSAVDLEAESVPWTQETPAKPFEPLVV
jgi:DNA-binding beta-propeller fold protein YncE